MCVGLLGPGFRRGDGSDAIVYHRGMKTLSSPCRWTLVAAVAALSGCVTTGTYKKLQADSDKRMSDAQAKIADLNSNLDKANASLKQTSDERDQLKASNQDLSKSLSSTQSELKKTVASLSEQNQTLQQKIADLTKSQDELQAKAKRELEDQQKTYDGLVGQLKQEISDGQVKITQIQGKLTVNVADKVFFNSGSADIKPEGVKVLLRVADVLKRITDKRISIEGHTDNVPISESLRDRYATNWELSTARATRVARFLQEKGGIDPSILSAVGYGEYHPIAGNDTAEGRAQNRRIEIVLLDKEVGRAAK